MNEYMYAIAGIFDTLVVIIFFDGVMKRRCGRGVTTGIYGLLFLTCIGSYILDVLELREFVIGWSILTLLGVSFLYEGTVLRRVFYVVFIQVIVMIAESICVLLGELSSIMNFVDSSLKDSIQLILSKLIFFFLTAVILLLKKQHGNIPKKHFIYFLIVPIISIFVVYGLADGEGLAWGISLLGVLFMNLVVYYILSLLSDYSAKIVREEMLQKQIQMQRDNYEQLSQSFKKGNRLLHDVNKHLRQVEQYLDQKEWAQASSYLKQIEGSLQENYKVIKSGNIVIDSILSNLKSQIESLGSTFVLEMHIDKSKLRIDDYDLVTILGNISDNVVEEMKKGVPGTVYFRVETAENELLIFVRNPLNQGKTIKRKKEPWFHGLGIENVKEAVEKYDGKSSFENKGSQFETMIMVPYKEG